MAWVWLHLFAAPHPSPLGLFRDADAAASPWFSSARRCSRFYPETRRALTARLSRWGWNRVAFIEYAAFMTSPCEVYHFAPRRGFSPLATLGFLWFARRRGSLLCPCPHARPPLPRGGPSTQPSSQREPVNRRQHLAGEVGQAGRGWGSAGTCQPSKSRSWIYLGAAEWSRLTACRG